MEGELKIGADVEKTNTKKWLKVILAIVITLIILYIIYNLVMKDDDSNAGTMSFRGGGRGGRGGFGRGGGRGGGFGRGRHYRRPTRGWGGTYYGNYYYPGYYGYEYGSAYPYGVILPSYGVVTDDIIKAGKTGCFSDLAAGLHYYFNDNCPYCETFTKVWKSVKGDLSDKMDFFEHNITGTNNSCIDSVPTIVAMNNGVFQKYEGKRTYRDIVNWLNGIYGF